MMEGRCPGAQTAEMNDRYRDVLGSDVINDGMYLELRDSSDTAVACVFRSDVSGEFEVHLGTNPVAPQILASFIERAKKHLDNRATNG
jgi:hypothetical protein